MADGASSAPAPAPAPVAARGRPTAAPGPIELADEKTVQTLATPDSFGAPLATHRRPAAEWPGSAPPPGMAPPGVPRVTPRNYPLFNSEDSATGDSSQSRGGGGSIDWRP